MTKVIDKFEGEYAFLSNFFHQPILLDGFVWDTNEHYYQAMKTLDPVERAAIREVSTPKEAKKLGRQCSMRTDWEFRKNNFMMRALEAKFQPGTLLAAKLVGTGHDTELIEGNTWHDNIWGACTCPNCANATKWNTLGKDLMLIRAILLNV